MATSDWSSPLGTSVLERYNVKVSGAGTVPMMFAHGFGCDQNMWRFVTPAFERDYRGILFDYVGHGRSDSAAYHPAKYGSLDGYAADVLEICRELDVHHGVFVGHSVSAMIGVVASLRERNRFDRLVMIGPSPRYIDDAGYTGGFRREDIEGLLDSLDSNYLGWSSTMAPVIMGNPDRPELGEELTNSFCRTDPEIVKQFARTTVGQPRGSGAGARPLSRAAMCGRRDCTRERRQVRACPAARQRTGSDACDRPLPEPQRPRGNHREGDEQRQIYA